MNDTPIAVFLKWFDACPEKIQMLISDFAVGHGPKLFPRQEGQLTTEAILAVLRGANDTFRLESIGLLLFIIQATNYIFAGNDTEEAFEHRREILELTRERMKQEPNSERMLRITDEELARLPAEAKLWVSEARRWVEIRDGELSLVSIRQWESDLMRRAHHQQMQPAYELMDTLASLFGRGGDKNEG